MSTYLDPRSLRERRESLRRFLSSGPEGTGDRHGGSLTRACVIEDARRDEALWPVLEEFGISSPAYEA